MPRCLWTTLLKLFTWKASTWIGGRGDVRVRAAVAERAEHESRSLSHAVRVRSAEHETAARRW